MDKQIDSVIHRLSKKSCTPLKLHQEESALHSSTIHGSKRPDLSSEEIQCLKDYFIDDYKMLQRLSCVDSECQMARDSILGRRGML